MSLFTIPCSALQEYVCLAFSMDGSFLAAQGAGPEWNLAVWQWEKSKLSGVVKGATQASHQLEQFRTPHSISTARVGTGRVAEQHVGPCSASTVRVRADVRP